MAEIIAAAHVLLWRKHEQIKVHVLTWMLLDLAQRATNAYSIHGTTAPSSGENPYCSFSRIKPAQPIYIFNISNTADEMIWEASNDLNAWQPRSHVFIWNVRAIAPV